VTELRALPLALERFDRIRQRLSGRQTAIFLDYDGTLTPIVERPEDAVLSPKTRATIERLASRCPVAVVSGRDLADVRAMVGVEGIAYAGSHGFDIRGPDGVRHQRGAEYLPDLDAAERELGPLVDRVPGARIERKTFAVAVHVRQVADERVAEVETAVATVSAAHPQLRRTGGKKVLELRPGIDWDKGKALRWLLEVLGLGAPGVLPVYVGDDETDEDAFGAIGEEGLGVVVRGEDDDRPTAARYALLDTDETRVFLDLIAETVGASVG
jgi:alpha,alpha-trehalase